METVQIRLTKELLKKTQRLVEMGIYSNKSEAVRDSLRRLTFNGNLIFEEERKFNVIFSSDLHGNMIQYKKLFKKAYNDKADTIIIGGDIAPKDPQHRTIRNQQTFLEKKLIPAIQEFNKKNKKRNHRCSLFLTMGNDDFKANYSFLMKLEKKVGFKLIHNRCIKLHEDTKIIGYSFVPLTPFVNKDWEKLDLNEKNEHKTRKGFLTEGRRTKGNHYIKAKFNLDSRKKTIERDLRRLLKSTNPKKTILVTHSPPYNTNLDMNNSGEHLGNEAVRKIIKEKQPFLTLHGHIHETINKSGEFRDKIKKTICVSSGNDHKGNSLSIIKFNLYNLNGLMREVI